MYKPQEKNVKKESPFAFDVEKLTKKSTEPKRNKDGIIMISKKDKESKEWYYHG